MPSITLNLNVENAPNPARKHFEKTNTNKLYFINQASYICPYKVFVMILQPIYTEARVKSNGNSDVMNLKAVLMAQWAY